MFILRLVLVALMASCALSVPVTGVRAREVPLSDAQVNITARNTDLPDFLERLFTEGGYRVQVSNSLRGVRINGRFTGTVSEVWERVSDAFNLVGYYDSAVIRVYSARDITTRRFEDVNAGFIVREARRLDLIDPRNSVTASGNSISATGVPAFLSQIAAIADRNRAALDDGGSAVPGPSGVYPSNDPDARYRRPRPDARAIVESEILRRASVRDPYEVRIFFLRYASANDTFVRTGDVETRVPGIASILAGIMGDGRIPQTVRTSGDDFDRFAPGLRPAIDIVGDDGIALVPTAPSNDNRAADRSDDLPLSVNGPRIEVDDTQNAVIVRDRPEAMSVHEGIIAALDQSPRMVEIEATIIDLNIDRLKDLGLEFDISVDGLNVLFGGDSFNPTPDFSNPNLEGSYVTGSGDTFAARLTALERNGAVNVVSRPQLITLDNRAALFDSTQEIYVEIEGAISRLERINIGTVLRVTPSVVYDDASPRVRLRIDIEDGSPTNSIVDGLPVLRRSRVASQAVINQGESLLIGGITIVTEFENRTKVPILGDIPLFGQLFRRRREGSTRVERLFLLTPRIVGVDDAGTAIRQRPPIPLETLQSLPADNDDERADDERRSNRRSTR
ncbi:MAG: type III secretion system outer membrane ring subunit SctC [Pseudomonadota bacterium]